MTTTDVQQPGYGRPDFGRRPQGQRLELTVEEVKVWHDCMKNSSVLSPSVVGATLGYGAFRFTRFRANAKYAAVFGGVIGLIMGRLTASELCLAKVASMPNSTLKERMMEAKFGNKHMSERHIFRPDVAPEAPEDSEEPSTGMVFDDYPSMNSYDTYSSLNDSSEISTSEDTDLTEPINLQKGTSYEELRHKNREDYYKKTRQYYAPQTPEKYPTTEATQQQQHYQQQTPASTPMQEKTKYGDVWG